MFYCRSRQYFSHFCHNSLKVWKGHTKELKKKCLKSHISVKQDFACGPWNKFGQKFVFVKANLMNYVKNDRNAAEPLFYCVLLGI